MLGVEHIGNINEESESKLSVQNGAEITNDEQEPEKGLNMVPS